jgi:hypothetical protein
MKYFGYAFAAFFLVTSTSQAALVTASNGLAVYDTETNLTWVLDANDSGAQYYENAVTWVENLVVDEVSGWRLPTADANNDGNYVNSCGGSEACQDNEMGWLYGEHGVSYDSPSPFIDIAHGAAYWTSTTNAQDGYPYAWRTLNFMDGTNVNLNVQVNLTYSLAVQQGDVFNAVPVPAAVWLFGSALAGLGWMRRKVT